MTPRGSKGASKAIRVFKTPPPIGNRVNVELWFLVVARPLIFSLGQGRKKLIGTGGF